MVLNSDHLNALQLPYSEQCSALQSWLPSVVQTVGVWCTQAAWLYRLTIITDLFTDTLHMLNKLEEWLFSPISGVVTVGTIISS